MAKLKSIKRIEAHHQTEIARIKSEIEAKRVEVRMNGQGKIDSILADKKIISDPHITAPQGRAKALDSVARREEEVHKETEKNLQYLDTVERESLQEANRVFYEAVKALHPPAEPLAVAEVPKVERDKILYGVITQVYDGLDGALHGVVEHKKREFEFRTLFSHTTELPAKARAEYIARRVEFDLYRDPDTGQHIANILRLNDTAPTSKEHLAQMGEDLTETPSQTHVKEAAAQIKKDQIELLSKRSSTEPIRETLTESFTEPVAEDDTEAIPEPVRVEGVLLSIQKPSTQRKRGELADSHVTGEIGYDGGNGKTATASFKFPFREGTEYPKEKASVLFSLDDRGAAFNIEEGGPLELKSENVNVPNVIECSPL